MLELLDKCYASNRASSRISTLTTMFSKRYQQGQDMARYVDDFESLFAQLEKMGTNTALPEAFKAPLLLSSLGTNSPLESTIAALRLRDVEELSWEAVTADLIQEYKRRKSTQRQPYKDGSVTPRNGKGKNVKSDTFASAAAAKRALEAKKGELLCTFCGRPGFTSDKCFLNPENDCCRIPKKAQDSIKALKSTPAKKRQQSKIEFGSIAVVRKA